MTQATRKLIVAALTTIDGVHDQPRSFAGSYFDGELVSRSMDDLAHCDAMLMGRTTYEYFVPVWSQPDNPYTQRINDMAKYVFSSTLTTAEWNNTTVISGDVVRAVAELKRQEGRDLMIYGYGQLAKTLLEHGLVDRLKFTVFPVVAGTGAPLFRAGQTTPLHLESTHTLANGTVQLSYSPQRDR
jgi:dihydrofolate reductase